LPDTNTANCSNTG